MRFAPRSRAACIGLLLNFSGLDHYSDHSSQNRHWTDGYLGLTIDAETGSVPWKFFVGPGGAGKDGFAERDL